MFKFSIFSNSQSNIINPSLHGRFLILYIVLLKSLLVAPTKTANAVDAQTVHDPPSGRFRCKIEKFSKLNTNQLYTESFYVGGFKWRVLIYPKGNIVDHLSMYLVVSDSETLSDGWSVDTKYSLSVINGIDKKFSRKKDSKGRQFNARNSNWGFSSFMPLSELCDPCHGYLVFDTCVVEAYVAVIHSAGDSLVHDLKIETGYVELKAEASKTSLGKGETPKSSSQGDINRTIRPTASGSDTILPQTDTKVPPPASKSEIELNKTLVPPTTPIVDKESMVYSPQAQDPVGSFSPVSINKFFFWIKKKLLDLRGSHLESSSFDDMDAYISKLVSVVEADAPFDSTTEGSVAASIPQSTIDEAKKFFIKMLSRDLSEIPDFAGHLTESISVLSKCSDLTPAQLAELNTLKAEFPTLLKTCQASNHLLKEVEEEMAEKQGTNKSLVEQVKINAFAFQMQRAIQKDLIAKEAELQQEVERLQAKLAKISEKKKDAEIEIKQLHGKTVNLEQSRSSVIEEISTLETKKKTAESFLSSVQQKWTELRHIFMESNN